MEKLLLFQIGNRQFGMKLSLIRNIYKTDAVFENQTEKKETGEDRPNQIRQTVFIDGEEIPLYDLSLLFSQDTTVSHSDGKRIILINLQEHFIAIKADRIEHVVSVTSDRIEPLPPIFGNPSLVYFPRVLKQPDMLILLLDPEGMERFEQTKTSEVFASYLKQSPEISEKDDFSAIFPLSEQIVSSEELNLISLAILKGIKELGKKAEDIEADELENLLTRIVREEIIANIIIRHLRKIIERMVFREIKRIRKSLRGLQEVRNEKWEGRNAT